MQKKVFRQSILIKLLMIAFFYYNLYIIYHLENKSVSIDIFYNLYFDGLIILFLVYNLFPNRLVVDNKYLYIRYPILGFWKNHKYLLSEITNNRIIRYNAGPFVMELTIEDEKKKENLFGFTPNLLYKFLEYLSRKEDYLGKVSILKIGLNKENYNMILAERKEERLKRKQQKLMKKQKSKTAHNP